MDDGLNIGIEFFIGQYGKLFNETKYNLQALNKRFEAIDRCMNNINLLKTNEEFDEKEENEELNSSPEDLDKIRKKYEKSDNESNSNKNKKKQNKKPKKENIKKENNNNNNNKKTNSIKNKKNIKNEYINNLDNDDEDSFLKNSSYEEDISDKDLKIEKVIADKKVSKYEEFLAKKRKDEEEKNKLMFHNGLKQMKKSKIS